MEAIRMTLTIQLLFANIVKLSSFFFGLFFVQNNEGQKREMEKHNVEKILLGILLLEGIY